MRTDDPIPAAPSAWARIRSRVEPARRWLSARGAGPRWALPLVPLALLVATAYHFASEGPAPTAWLYNGHKFPADEAVKVAQALAARGIAGVVVDDGKVGVPGDRLADALTVLAKSRLAPRSAKGIADEPPEPGPFEDPASREGRRRQQEEKVLGQMIQEVDESIESVIVHVEHPRPRPFGAPEPATATVRLTTEGDRPLSPRTVEKIQAVLMAWERLGPESVTIFDRRGTLYLASGTPAPHVHPQARADELRSKLLDELDWIKGIKVSVRIDAASPRPSRARPGPRPADRPPAVVPNAPASLTPEAAPADDAPADPPGGARAPGKVNVLVQVPLSFYLRHPRPEDPRHDPSAAELHVLAEKTEKLIRTAVAHVVPEGERGAVEVVRIDPPGPPPATTPAFAEPRRPEPGWAAAAVAGAAAAVAVLAVGGGVLAGRRPRARPDRRRRYEPHIREDAPGARPAPSERVRDLVRRDPEAAAGVLQRWIGQGGDAA